MDLDRNKLIDMISKSTFLRKELSFKDHLLLHNAIHRFPEDKLDSLFLKLSEEVKAPKPNPIYDRYINIGLYVACMAIPLPMLSDLVVYLKNVQNWKCRLRCEKAKEDKQLCYRKCNYESIKYAVKYINKELKKCPKSKDPEKCRKKLFKLLIIWRKKLVESGIKLKYQVKKSSLRK